MIQWQKIILILGMVMMISLISNEVQSADYEINNTWTCRARYNVSDSVNLAGPWYSNTSANIFKIEVNVANDWDLCTQPVNRSIALQNEFGNKIPYQFIDLTQNASGSMSFFRVGLTGINLTVGNSTLVDMFVKESGGIEQEYLSFTNPFTISENPSDPRNAYNVSYVNSNGITTSFQFGDDGAINAINEYEADSTLDAFSGLDGATPACTFFPGEDAPCQTERNYVFNRLESGAVFDSFYVNTGGNNMTYYVYHNKNNWSVVDIVFGNSNACDSTDLCLFVSSRNKNFPDGTTAYFWTDSTGADGNGHGTIVPTPVWRNAGTGDPLFYGVSKNATGDKYVAWMWSDSLQNNNSGGITNWTEGLRSGDFFRSEGGNSDDRYGAVDTEGTRSITRAGVYGTRILVIPTDGTPADKEFQDLMFNESAKFRYGTSVSLLNENDIQSNVAPTHIQNYTIPQTVAFLDTWNWFVEVNGTDDGDVVEYVNFTITFPNGTVMQNNTNGTSAFSTPNQTYNFSSDTFTADDGGIYNLEATIKDSGTVTTLTVEHTFTIADDQNPNVTIDVPLNNTELLVSSVAFNFSRMDNTRINTCTYYLDMTGSNITISNCNNFTLDLTEGSHNMTIFVNDSSGNYGSAYVNFSIANDTVAPNVTVNAPAGTQTSRDLTGTFNVTDVGGIDACLYNITDSSGAFTGGISVNRIISNCANNGSVSFTINADLSNIRFNVWANDTNGNQNSSFSTFTVDTTVAGGGVTGGGGGAAPSALLALGASCTQDVQCASGVCDLEISRINKTSVSSNTCIQNFCGNQLCGKNENILSCPLDCGPTSGAAPGIVVTSALVVGGSALAFILFSPKTQINRIKRFFTRRRKNKI